jgi:hypothetical protein
MKHLKAKDAFCFGGGCLMRARYLANPLALIGGQTSFFKFAPQIL